MCGFKGILTVTYLLVLHKANLTCHHLILKFSDLCYYQIFRHQVSTLMGFTWIFGFVAAFVGEGWMWYVFIVLNSLQGVYIFVAFIANHRVWKLLRERFVSLRPSTANSSRTTRSPSHQISAESDKGNRDFGMKLLDDKRWIKLQSYKNICSSFLTESPID